MKGKKFDEQKARWCLLPWQELEEVVKVMMHGSKKYEDFNWQKVSNGKERYFNAAMRHILAWQKGEIKDKESDLAHLAHAVCCLLFLMWHNNPYKEVSK